MNLKKTLFIADFIGCIITADTVHPISEVTAHICNILCCVTFGKFYCTRIINIWHVYYNVFLRFLILHSKYIHIDSIGCYIQKFSDIYWHSGGGSMGQILKICLKDQVVLLCKNTLHPADTCRPKQLNSKQIMFFKKLSDFEMDPPS